jgi:hypothetical protein
MKSYYSRLFRPLMLAFLFEPGIFLLGNDTGALAEEPTKHPLAWTLAYASSSSEYIRENVRDYECRLIKRERMDGKLQLHHFVDVKVRCEQRIDGEVVKPMAVFMRFLAPAKVKDRRILFVEGENDGKMSVRKGGISFKNVTLNIDPASDAAKRESNYPITNIGFDKIMERLIEVATADIKSDPTAANTVVSHFRNAKINNRVCTHLRVVHPEQGEGVLFHEAELYIDSELRVPIRLVVYGFPESDGAEKPVLEEYSYVDLKLNVGLTDEDFSEDNLNSSPAAAKSPEAQTARSPK